MKSHSHKGNLLQYFHRILFSLGFHVFVVVLGVLFMVVFQLITASCLLFYVVMPPPQQNGIEVFCLPGPTPGCCWWPGSLAFSRTCEVKV